MDYSPTDKPERYYIDDPINGIELIFGQEFLDGMDFRPIEFVGKHGVIQVVMIY